MSEYVVGKKYPVECVRASYPHRSPIKWWPVMGEVHEDKKHLDFPMYHWHVDWRFVADYLLPTKCVKARSGAFLLHERVPDVRTMLARPVMIYSIVPRPLEKLPPPYTMYTEPKDMRPNQLPKVPIGWWKKTKLRTYYRPYPNWVDASTFGILKFQKLEEAFSTASLLGDNRRICPHRGYDLSDVVPDENGHIQCPVHGLMWCARTGQNVRPQL